MSTSPCYESSLAFARAWHACWLGTRARTDSAIGWTLAMTRGDDVNASLNELQVLVLHWISDGCPGGVWADERHKTSAAALKSRGLVRITRPNRKWTATITEAGTYYLEHGQFQESPAKQMGARQKPARKEPKPVLRTPPTPRTPRPCRSKPLAPTAQFVKDVIDAGGVLPVGTNEGLDHRRAEQLVRSANRFGKCPPGTRMATRGSWRDREAFLEDGVPVVIAQKPTDMECAVVSRGCRVPGLGAGPPRSSSTRWTT